MRAAHRLRAALPPRTPLRMPALLPRANPRFFSATSSTNMKVKFDSPERTHKTPILVELLSEEEASNMAQIWPATVSSDFKGKDGQSLLYYSSLVDGSEGPSRFLWIGLGKKEKLTLQSVRKATNLAVNKIQSMKLKSGTISVDASQFMSEKIPKEQLVFNMANTAILGNYTFDRYITKPLEERAAHPVEELSLTLKSPNGTLSAAEIEKMNVLVDAAKIYAQATNYARDLSNTRADECNPEYMERQARDLVQKHPDLFSIEVIAGDELKARGMNLINAVGQGSNVPPRLVLLHYKPSGASDAAPVALVGKGITFDTGGLNLKPTNFIEEMYMDMSGSAAVLATMSALPALKHSQSVVGVLALAENSISDRAVHPSSIVKSLKGLTVEIDNTDAEGRLVLADALTYVQRQYKPTTVVDLATLTGACVVALGEYAAGLFSNNDELIRDLQAASKATHERVWHMPLYDEYSAEMKGAESDLKNTGKGRYGGACTAAAFLKHPCGCFHHSAEQQEFIEEKVHWAHLDIAGPAMTSEKRDHVPKGGTGFGVQLLLEFLRRKALETESKPSS